MANASTKSTTSAEYGTPAEELERARTSTMEHLQQASAEIDEARQEATGGVRRSLDSAVERLCEVRGELRRRAEDQTAEWQDALEQAPEKVRREMGRRAIRSQRTPEALEELRAEMREREAHLGRLAKGPGATG
jgi:prefoldin subunit 5